MTIKLYKHTITVITDKPESGELILSDFLEHYEELSRTERETIGNIAYTNVTKKPVKIVEDK